MSVGGSAWAKKELRSMQRRLGIMTLVKLDDGGKERIR